MPFIWTMLALYVACFFMDMMNTASTIATYIGILGIIAIIYLSYRTRLGITLLTKKQKQK